MSKYILNGRPISVAAPSALNCDSLIPFSDRLRTFQHTFYIAVICSPIEGLGDLAFGIKFTQQIVDRYSVYRGKVRVSLLVPDSNPNAVNMAMQNLRIEKIYRNDGSEEPGNVDDSPVKLYVMHRRGTVYTADAEDVFLAPDRPVPAHIAFISPGTNINSYRINFGNVKAGTEPATAAKTFVLSEYNTSDRYNQAAAVTLTDLSVDTGVYDPSHCAQISRLCPTGVFLAEDRDYPRLDKIPAGRHYSCTYIYTDEVNMVNYYRSSRERAGDETERLIAHSESERRAAGAPSHLDDNCNPASEKWRRSMMILISTFYRYIKELEEYRQKHRITDKIIVYLQTGTLENLKKYLVLEKNYIPGMLELWNFIEDVKSPFEFRNTPGMNMKEMLSFFQHSIPIAYLSGDNTPMEFISVNRAPELKLFYIAFYWKRALAQALGVRLDAGGGRIDAAGMATIDRVKFLHNIGNNFGITGMKQVENLMTNVMIGRQQTCENRDFHTIATRVKTPNHFVFSATPEGESILRFKLPDNSFNTTMLRGAWDNIGGGLASEVMRTSWDPNRPNDVFVKFLECAGISVDNCKQFDYDLRSNPSQTVGGVIVIPTPQCISCTILSKLINDYIADDNAEKYLVRTYATVLNNGICGAAHAAEQMNKHRGGLFLIQDLIPNTATFRNTFRCKALSIENYYKAMVQLTWILAFLQDKINFVHNDLWSANVLLEHYGEEREVDLRMDRFRFRFNSVIGIRLIDVDNAAFNFQPAGARLISVDGYGEK